MHSLLCNWRGQWCSLRAVLQYFPQAHTGVKNPSVPRGFIQWEWSQRGFLTSCCSCVGCPSLLTRDDSSPACSELYLAGASLTVINAHNGKQKDTARQAQQIIRTCQLSNRTVHPSHSSAVPTLGRIHQAQLWLISGIIWANCSKPSHQREPFHGMAQFKQEEAAQWRAAVCLHLQELTWTLS